MPFLVWGYFLKQGFSESRCKINIGLISDTKKCKKAHQLTPLTNPAFCLLFIAVFLWLIG